MPDARARAAAADRAQRIRPESRGRPGFEELSADAAISEYFRDRSDPGAAWELSPRSVASLFGFFVSAGHLLFHDHLDVSIPAVTDWLTERLERAV